MKMEARPGPPRFDAGSCKAFAVPCHTGWLAGTAIEEPLTMELQRMAAAPISGRNVLRQCFSAIRAAGVNGRPLFGEYLLEFAVRQAVKISRHVVSTSLK